MQLLQKNCVLASAGAHVMLVVILLFGSAFVAPNPAQTVRSPAPSVGLIQLMSSARETEPAQMHAPTEPQPKQPRQEMESPQPPQDDVNSFVPVQRRAATPQISTNLVLRHTRSSPASPSLSSQQARADQLGRTIDRIVHGLSTATTIQLSSDDAGGNSSYAELVRDVYSRAWKTSDLATQNQRTAAKATVTIARDGSVTSARLLQPSGDELADQSVRQLLKNVTSIVPFEPSAKEKQRTYSINFNLLTE